MCESGALLFKHFLYLLGLLDPFDDYALHESDFDVFYLLVHVPHEFFYFLDLRFLHLLIFFDMVLNRVDCLMFSLRSVNDPLAH